MGAHVLPQEGKQQSRSCCLLSLMEKGKSTSAGARINNTRNTESKNRIKESNQIIESNNRINDSNQIIESKNRIKYLNHMA